MGVEQVKRIIVLVLENRSFDHVFGYSGIRGHDAITGEPTAVDGLRGDETNELRPGEAISVSPDAEWALPFDPHHEFPDVLAQLCGPDASLPEGGGYPPISNQGFASRMARELQQKGRQERGSSVMRCFTPERLPVLHALANEFAVCDRWFSSLPGPTWPNRFFFHAASSAGLDASPERLRPVTALLDGYVFPNGTIYDRVDDAGRDWCVVEGDALPQALAIHGMNLKALDGKFITMDEFERRLQRPVLNESLIFIEPHYGHVLVDGSSFKCGNSEHPRDDITRGEGLVQRVYEAIRASDHWDSSMLVIAYDEHGGFYDHVVPPAAPSPGDVGPDYGNNRHGFDFTQLGVRVPAVVISPLIPKNTIDHTTYDHSSVPATVGALFGTPPLTERDRHAENLLHLLSLSEPRADTPLTLPRPAISGLPDCDDHVHRLAGELMDVVDALSDEVDPALVGFLHVAARRDHQMAVGSGSADAAEGEHRRIHERVVNATNRFHAARYIRDIQTRYDAWRSRG